MPEAITRERELTAPLRAQADAIIDTSALNVHQLRRRVVTEFALGNSDRLSLLFESFAYKRGVPAEADFVFDARVLPNPHWDPELRPLTGRDAGVRDYLDKEPDVIRYSAQIVDLLDTWLPRLRNDTRSYVTIAFGCTGGKHRSCIWPSAWRAMHANRAGRKWRRFIASRIESRDWGIGNRESLKRCAAVCAAAGQLEGDLRLPDAVTGARLM